MPSAVFISWVRHHGRSEALAAELGVACHFVAVGTPGRRATAPARYAIQALATSLLLVLRRPRLVICMAPPNTLLRLALVYCRLRRGRLVVDAHSDAVLRRPGFTTRASFARLAQRADAIIVTNRELAARLPDNASAFVLDDPPQACYPALSPPHDPARRPVVAVPLGWAMDEPIGELLDAVRELPDVDVMLTGRPRGPARHLLAGAPSNVRATGRLSDEDYHRLLSDADVVVALTTRSETMQRAGYEAMSHHTPLVTTGSAALRAYFSQGTEFAMADASDLAGAIRRALEGNSRLAAEMASLHEVKREGYEAQLAALTCWLHASPTGA